jgi:hypothetical protein
MDLNQNEREQDAGKLKHISVSLQGFNRERANLRKLTHQSVFIDGPPVVHGARH